MESTAYSPPHLQHFILPLCCLAANESDQFDDHEPVAPSCLDHQSGTSDAPQSHPRDPDKEVPSPPPSSGEPVGDPVGSAEVSSSKPVESKRISEMKAALKPGVQLQGNLNPEVEPFVPSSLRLNPSARPFVPGTVRTHSVLDPTSPEFTPNSSKHAPTSASASSTSLDPNSPTFVPGHSTSNSSLNAAAPEFIPVDHQPGMVNGDQSCDPLEENLVPLEREEVPFLTVEDITRGFDGPVEAESDVEKASLLLRTSAEMLLTVSVLPGMFERQKLELADRLEAWTPSHEAVSKVGAMLLHWVGAGSPLDIH